jgi:hypothetical protein
MKWIIPLIGQAREFVANTLRAGVGNSIKSINVF